MFPNHCAMGALEPTPRTIITQMIHRLFSHYPSNLSRVILAIIRARYRCKLTLIQMFLMELHCSNPAATLQLVTAFNSQLLYSSATCDYNFWNYGSLCFVLYMHFNTYIECPENFLLLFCTEDINLSAFCAPADSFHSTACHNKQPDGDLEQQTNKSNREGHH